MVLVLKVLVMDQYIDNTCNQATTVMAGTAYTISVETRNNTQKAVAYIDWDNNGGFWKHCIRACFEFYG